MQLCAPCRTASPPHEGLWTLHFPHSGTSLCLPLHAILPMTFLMLLSDPATYPLGIRPWPLLPTRVRPTAPHVQTCPLSPHHTPACRFVWPTPFSLLRTSFLLPGPYLNPLLLQTPVQAPTSPWTLPSLLQPKSPFLALISYRTSDNIIVFGICVQKHQRPWLSHCPCPPLTEPT